MKAKIIKKFLGLLLIVAISINMLSITYVQASIQEEDIQNSNSNLETENQNNLDLNKILETEDTIMMYDAKTNETTEVDIEQLKQEVLAKSRQSSKIKITENSISTESYTPPAGTYITKNIISKDTQNRNVIARSDPYVSLDVVNDTSYKPYLNVCKVKDATGTSTCALVGPRIALTAAHCVFDDKNNEAFKNWTLYPGHNCNYDTNETYYYGTACGWDKVYYSKTWKDTHNRNYDWAICILQSDVGNQLGYFSVKSYIKYSELYNKEIRIYGYPLDSRVQQTAWGFINQVPKLPNSYDLFGYYSITRSSMSGGPIVELNDVTTIIGIIEGRDHNNDKEGVGVRITQEMINIIASNM